MMTAESNAGSRRPLTPPSMLRILADNWWLLLLRGIAAVIFGVLAFFMPGLTLFSLIILFGAFALMDGIFALWTAFTGGKAVSELTPRWWLILIGVLGLATAAITVLYPITTGLVLLYFIAGWAIASGIFTIVGAVALRKEIEGEWMLVANGLLSILIGLFMFVSPGAGALALAWLIGIYALIFGVILVALSLRLRKFKSA